jgi:hypothetical protein
MKYQDYSFFDRICAEVKAGKEGKLDYIERAAFWQAGRLNHDGLERLLAHTDEPTQQ